ncbi:hypothetical protein [Leptospira santarosai]|uniref:hypothetical protein n=1 Tax=Leptospira santarosai TaxID=28183 RepID=UPI0024AFDD41|nr:hypothetical protein [Leptospira santarosai]MDI7165913.1 hypothetical protein [Leptospira santarosai]
MENGIYGLMLFLTIGLLFFSWNVLWKGHLVDRTREDLFALRDRLFELGLKQNGIKFSDPAYQSFEAIINGTIRFTHRISFLRYVIFRSLTNLFMSGYKISSTLGIELDQGVKKLDSRGQINLKPLLEEYERIVISHLVFKSFFLLTFTFLVGIAYSVMRFQIFAVEGISKGYQNFRVKLRVLYNGTIKDIQYNALNEMNATI